MPAIFFKVEGTVLVAGKRVALMLHAEGDSHILRLGLVLRGTEEVILPESLLDDWGHEMATLELYTWLKENGTHFPRAEIFGYDLAGRARQCFVRELELLAGYPCYMYESPAVAYGSGLLLEAILLPGAAGREPERLRSPAGVISPLAEANVQWWTVDAAAAHGSPDRSFLD